MNSDAEWLGGVAAVHQVAFFFSAEYLKGLGLQTNARGVLVYLGLAEIYVRIGKGGLWGEGT